MNRRESRISRAAFAAIALILVLGAAGVALAHDEHGTELKGTIKTLTSEKLVMTATDGDVVEFMVAESTKFLRGTTVVKPEDVAVGERAIVKYMKMGDMLHATEVKLAEKKP